MPSFSRLADGNAPRPPWQIKVCPLGVQHLTHRSRWCRHQTLAKQGDVEVLVGQIDLGNNQRKHQNGRENQCANDVNLGHLVLGFDGQVFFCFHVGHGNLPVLCGLAIGSSVIRNVAVSVFHVWTPQSTVLGGAAFHSHAPDNKRAGIQFAAHQADHI
jgi:hypothetical protein